MSYYDQVKEAAEAIRVKVRQIPEMAIVLGSGLGDFAGTLGDAVSVPYGDLPHWPASNVIGHEGRLVVGTVRGRTVAALSGRCHVYEGHDLGTVTFGVRALGLLGVGTLMLTNAAGGINTGFSQGALMVIDDHINLTGHNPLVGPNDDRFGPRFPDMSQAYDRGLMDLARQVAVQEKITLREGIYCGLSGPSFEGPADLRFLRSIGTDAVGMSTVPEVIVARHGGMRVLGFSGISNKANLDGSTVTTHEEVMEAGQVITPKIEKIIRGVLRSL